MTSEPLTDDDRIAYWQGAYERMAARNHELSAERDQLLAALKRLRMTARILHQNSVGCAVNHYGDDHAIHGLPGWLADTLADIEAAEAAIATSPTPSPDKEIHR